MFPFRKPTVRRRPPGSGCLVADAVTAEAVTVHATSAAGTVTVDRSQLVDALMALAEHHNELLESGEIETDDEGGLAAALACWAAVLAAEGQVVADRMGALRAFGCAEIADRIAAGLGVQGDPAFTRRQDEAEARHRVRLRDDLRSFGSVGVGPPPRRFVPHPSLAARARSADQN